MSQKILVYGHGDTSADGFPNPEALEAYIGGGVFRNEDGRYRYTQRRAADIIVLCRDGLAFGHFEVDGMEDPKDVDRAAYPPAKQVYLIRRSIRYENRVRMSDLDVVGYQFGKYIDEVGFADILKLAGKKEEFSA